MIPLIFIPKATETLVCANQATPIRLQIENVPDADTCSWTAVEPLPRHELIFKNDQGPFADISIVGDPGELGEDGSIRCQDFTEEIRVKCRLPGGEVIIVQQPVRFKNVCTGSEGVSP